MISKVVIRGRIANPSNWPGTNLLGTYRRKDVSFRTLTVIVAGNMGGWQSTTSSQKNKPDLPGEFNNNKGDTVVIPVDASQQAEAAFLCKQCVHYL